MKDVLKLMLIPIAGSIAIGLVFLLVVWGGNFHDFIVDDESPDPSLQRDLIGAAIITPTANCDDSYFPVCGFDDVTYDNACKAVTAGTKVAHRGACGTPQA